MLLKVVGDKRVPKISSEMYFFWTIHCHQVVELYEYTTEQARDRVPGPEPPNCIGA